MSRIVQAAVSTVALLALLVGWPVALLVAVGNPWPVGGIDLSAQISDDAIIFGLTAILWLCWAQFVVCVVVEAIAAVRGVAFPKRVPIAFGFEQELARRLIGAVLAAVLGSGVAASAAAAEPVAALPAGTPATAQQAAQPAAEEASTVGKHLDQHPVVTVQRDDTLWALARDHLGDPTRWREIRELNIGRTMVDGQAFGQAERIRPGWQLRMPTDAVGLDEASPVGLARPAPNAQPNTVRVQRGDTLSALAQRHLGSPDRWRDIMRLNAGQAQPDGGKLTNPNLLQPGWVLQLPTGPAKKAQPGPDGRQQAAPRHAQRQPEPLQKQNIQQQDQRQNDQQGRSQQKQAGPDRQNEQAGPQQQQGHQQQDQQNRNGQQGNPQQEQAVPQQQQQAGPGPQQHNQQQRNDRPENKDGQQQKQDAQSPREGAEPNKEQAEQRSEQQSPPAVSPGTGTTGQTTIPVPPAPQSADPPADEDVEPVSATSAADDGDSGQAALWAAGGIGIVLASGLVTYLGRRRRQQVRRRQFGERIALPDGDGAAMETELRQIESPISVESVDLALRHIALAAAESQTPLPKVQLARLLPDAFEVYLAQPTELPEPFESTSDSSLWRVPREHVADLAADAEQLRTAVPAPYPGLVTLGVDDEGGQIMVDLEQLGALGVVGHPELTREVLAAITIELSLSQWADDLLVTVVNGFADLEDGLGTGRVQHRELEDALTTLETRARAARADLDEIGADRAAQARADEWDERLWIPEIVVVLGELEPAQQRRLDAVVSELPRVAVAAVSQTSTSARWVAEVAADGADGVKAVLQPAGIRVVPQRVTRNAYQHVLGLAEVTRRPAVPAEESPVEVPPQRKPLDTRTAIGDVAYLRSLLSYEEVDDPNPPTAAAAEPATAEPDPDPEPRPTPAVPEQEPAVTNTDLRRAATPPGGRPPMVLVLGPLDIADADGPIDDDRRNKALEIAAYLALRPGTGVEAFTDALWPDRSPATQQSSARRNRVRELRKWLGTDAEGRSYVPEFRRGSPYEMHPDVRTDWDLWRDLVGDDPRVASTAHLDQALRLIRGRPFEGVKTGTYAWAQPLITEMLAQIEDVADEVGRRRLEEGRWLAAERAASVGLLCEPVSERLYRTQIRAAYAAGNLGNAQEAINRMLVFFAKLESDVEEEDTAQLLELVREGAPREQVLGIGERL